MIRVKNSFLFFILIITLLGCNQVPNSPDSPNTVTASMPKTTISDDSVVSAIPDTKPPLTLTPAINSPTAIVQTIEDSSKLKLSGVLYLWVNRFLDPLYTNVDFSINNLPVFLENRSSPKEIVKDDMLTVGLAFAPYSSRIAYVTRSTSSIDLWSADINLVNIEHLWKNDREWLGSSPELGNLSIKWGPSDSSLILSSYLIKNHLLVYSFKTNKAFEVLGACDQVAPLPDADRFTIWCSFNSGDSSPYGFFTADGDIIFTKEKPEQAIDVFEWSFSPNNQSLAFIPKEGNAIILEEQGNKLELPIQLLKEPGDFRSMPFLQWSENGDRLLIYGYNREYCPLIENPISGNLEIKECWQVIKPSTGKILWGPNRNSKEIEKATGVPLKFLYSRCAGLSPDSEWIALCYQSGAIENFLIISLKNTGKVIDFGSGGILDFRWVDK